MRLTTLPLYKKSTANSAVDFLCHFVFERENEKVSIASRYRRQKNYKEVFDKYLGYCYNRIKLL